MVRTGFATGSVLWSTRAAARTCSRLFGYRELFHALVVIAVAVQYTVVAAFVIPS
jgi:predicted membrane channel-forming protein YqfA (hemolysin III family)